jgi:16S rRNA (cytosine1402-N4)-methyltransferase
VATASERLRPYIERATLRIIEGNFADVDELPTLAGDRFDGILLDLGVSSHQVDEEGRGFTFRRGAPLDMRMGTDASQTAADFLNNASVEELAHVLRDYADEPRSRRMASEIVRRRRQARFATSDDLVGAIRAVLGAGAGPSEFARVFQGIRIVVNDELTGLERALPLLRDRLAPGGILAVIAYHSGEDRLVKHAFQDWSRSCICPPRQPVCTCRGHPLGTTLTRKPVSASEAEIAANPRARSAHLRAWQSAA